MIQNWFENNIFIYIILGICGGGVFFKFILSMKYRLLIRASKHMGTSKNKLMRVLRLKFETCYKLKLGVNNVDSFVDKYVYRHRFCGLLLYTWETISGEFVILCMLSGSIFAVLGLVNGCERNDILYTFLTGVLGCAVLITYDFFINLTMKRKVLKTNISDYLENFLKARLESDESSAELLEQYKKEYFDLPNQLKAKGKKKKAKKKKEAIPVLSAQAETSVTKVVAKEEPNEEKIKGKRKDKRKDQIEGNIEDKKESQKEEKNEEKKESKKDEATRRREAKKNELKKMILADKEKRNTLQPEQLEVEEKNEETQLHRESKFEEENVLHKENIQEKENSYEKEKKSSIVAIPNEEYVQKEAEKETAATEMQPESEVVSMKNTIPTHTNISEEEARIIEDILREFLS